MATLPLPAQPEAAKPRTTDTKPSNPFYQSTPRTNASSPNLATIMSAAATPPTTAAVPTVSRPVRHFTTTLRRPQCTHISMIRIYGEGTCGMCGRNPDLGWLYVCQQDHQPGQRETLPDIDTMPVVDPRECDYFEAKAHLAEYLRMSASVISGIRTGAYDIDQVDKLLAQREMVISTIKKHESVLAENCAINAVIDQTSKVIASAGISVSTGSNDISAAPAEVSEGSDNPARSDSKMMRRMRKKPACNFQVCHTCRPFFQDRMFSSFNAVPTFPTEGHPRIVDRDTALTIGLSTCPTPLQDSFGTLPGAEQQHHGTDDADDEISVDWTRTSISDTISEHLDGSELYPCPGAGQCPVWSRHSGCAYDRGFDDGQRDMNHGFFSVRYADKLTPENSNSSLPYLVSSTPGASSTASSASLPTPTTTLLTREPSSELRIETLKDVAMMGKANSIL